MTSKYHSKSSNMGVFDSLPIFHHHQQHVEDKLAQLFSLVDHPKNEIKSDDDIQNRFHQIQTLLNEETSHDIINYLNLSKNDNSHPTLLLHLLCFLFITDSIELIASYLGLSYEEVKELLRELHHTFNIDSLRSRILSYHETNKRLRDQPDRDKEHELVGVEKAEVPKDSQEDHRKRLRRKYGHIEKELDVPEPTI